MECEKAVIAGHRALEVWLLLSSYATSELLLAVAREGINVVKERDLG